LRIEPIVFATVFFFSVVKGLMALWNVFKQRSEIFLKSVCIADALDVGLWDISHFSFIIFAYNYALVVRFLSFALQRTNEMILSLHVQFPSNRCCLLIFVVLLPVICMRICNGAESAVGDLMFIQHDNKICKKSFSTE